jgi:hypothetical protein
MEKKKKNKKGKRSWEKTEEPPTGLKGQKPKMGTDLG